MGAQHLELPMARQDLLMTVKKFLFRSSLSVPGVSALHVVSSSRVRRIFNHAGCPIFINWLSIASCNYYDN